MENPLVSVIIPMYNSAKFIPQTLESLLYQTLKDFEVTVVDDCSTDNSVEVVESFKGLRLHVLKLPEHTGTPGLPRNVGIKAARGKYIAFLDSDDFFTKTALEELTTLAEEFQAEVIHMDSWYILWNGRKKYDDDPKFFDVNNLLTPETCLIRQPSENVPTFDKPTFDTDDIAERLDAWLNWNYNWATYLTFARRDFLIANQIYFPNLETVGDMLFTFECLCLAKKFLRVPNITNIIRPRAGSVSRENDRNLDIQAFLHKRVSSIKEGFNAFEKLMDRVPFLQENPACRYAVKDFFFKQSVRYAWQLNRLYKNNEPFVLNELVRKEFHPDDAALASYFFDVVNLYRIQIEDLKKDIGATRNLYRTVAFCTMKLNQLNAEYEELRKKLGQQ